MKTKGILILGIILFLGILLRLYRFDNPIADWHSWRQADTAAVSKFLITNNFDLLHPQYFDISNVQSGLDNPNGYRMVEFPVYNLLQASLYKVLPLLSIEMWGRLVTIFFSITTALFLYLIVKRYSSEKEGLFVAFFYTFLPFSIYYGRTILPDTAMAGTVLVGIYFFIKYIDGKNTIISLFLSTFFIAISILLKPYAVFFVLPIIYLAFNKYKIATIKKPQLWIMAICSIVPFVFWRMWISQFPEGIPVSTWLFNGGNIRFTGAFFYWIFGKRIAELILGYFGITLLLLGLFKKEKEKYFGLWVSFLLSAGLYIFVIARGNVQHDYYQILIMPTLALFVGRGLSWILATKEKTNYRIGLAVSLVIILFSFAFSWYQVRDYFNVNNNSMVIAGKKADQILPKDAIVIAPYDGDTTFLYHINRKGWPVFQKSIEELIDGGAGYLVIASPTPNDFSGFGTQYNIMASSDDYLILKIR